MPVSQTVLMNSTQQARQEQLSTVQNMVRLRADLRAACYAFMRVQSTDRIPGGMHGSCQTWRAVPQALSSERSSDARLDAEASALNTRVILQHIRHEWLAKACPHLLPGSPGGAAWWRPPGSPRAPRTRPREVSLAPHTASGGQPPLTRPQEVSPTRRAPGGNTTVRPRSTAAPGGPHTPAQALNPHTNKKPQDKQTPAATLLPGPACPWPPSPPNPTPPPRHSPAPAY